MRISLKHCSALVGATLILTPALSWAALLGPDIKVFETAKTSLKDAAMLAEKSSGGKAVDVDFTTEKDTPVFDVTIAKGDATEHYTVNAAGASPMAVLKKNLMTKLEPESKSERQAAQSAAVSLIAAVGKAESATGGKAIDVELETSGGPHYDIELVMNGATLKTSVDAASGEVKNK